MKDKILQILKNPLLNLWINIFVMSFQFMMSAHQCSDGDTMAAGTFLLSGISCITAVIYWILVYISSKK